eukprot:204218_1
MSSKNSSLQTILLADHNDLYNTVFRWIIWPILLYHCFNFIAHSFNVEEQANARSFQYQSSDVGLSMKIKQHFPMLYLNGHSYFAMLSVFLIVIQKQLISLHSQKKTKTLIEYIRRTMPLFIGIKTFWNLHKLMGILTLLSVLIFDICGFLMGPYSDWDKFDIFSYFFFAPWIFMIIGVYGTAKFKMWIAHRYFSNMLLKACIVTPIARIAGAMCQNIGIWGEEFGYYYGIGAVTVMSTIWLLYELFQLIAINTTSNY